MEYLGAADASISSVSKPLVCEKMLVSLIIKISCIVTVSNGYDSAGVHLRLLIYLHLKRGPKAK